MATDIIMGHQGVRERIPSVVKRDRWTPISGINSAVLRVFTSLISVGIARKGAFKPSFSDYFGMWLMRPRMSWMMLVWYCVSRRYSWAVLDVVLEECLLNVFALGYTIRFLHERSLDKYGC